MNDLDEMTFARFAERFARIERQVPEPPLRVVDPAVARRRLARFSPIAAFVGVAILLAGIAGLAAIGPQPSPSPAAATIPPDTALPAVVLDAYLRALEAGDCDTARALTDPPFYSPSMIDLCGLTGVTRFSIEGDPVIVSPIMVRLRASMTITGMRAIPAGEISFTYFLQQVRSGAWRIVDGGPHLRSSPDSPPPVQATTLQGRILDAKGRPVPDATVYAYPGPERGAIAGSTVTDADGRWAITLPSGNRYCLELDLSIAGPAGTTATEWQAYYGPAGIGQPTDAWPCLDQVGNIVLDATLPAMHLVSGTIVDKAGRPITLIEAGGPFTKFELTVSSPSMGATSRPGADGRFSIWVPEGSWSVIAWVFRDEQPFLSPATTLEVRTDPISDFTLRVDTSSLNVE